MPRQPGVCDSLSVLHCGAQAGGLTLWVKRTDVPNARYTASLQVGAASTVDEFIARWVAQARLELDPGLVSLRLVQRGPCSMPTAEQEAAALSASASALADPSMSLAEAGVTDRSWLVAVFARSGV